MKSILINLFARFMIISPDCVYSWMTTIGSSFFELIRMILGKLSVASFNRLSKISIKKIKMSVLVQAAWLMQCPILPAPRSPPCCFSLTQPDYRHENRWTTLQSKRHVFLKSSVLILNHILMCRHVFSETAIHVSPKQFQRWTGRIMSYLTRSTFTTPDYGIDGYPVTCF